MNIKKTNDNSYEVIKRLKGLLGITKDAELSRKLGIPSTTYASQKKRKLLPYFEIIRVCRERKFDLNYVFFGKALNTDLGIEQIAQLLLETIRNEWDKELMDFRAIQEKMETLYQHLLTKEAIEDAKNKVKENKLR